MPCNTGGILITTLDIDPHGGLVSFGGTWQPHIDLTTTRPGTVVVQILPPDDAADPDHADVTLWIARNHHWTRLAGWKKTGRHWSFLAAPLIHAAMHPQLNTPRATPRQ